MQAKADARESQAKLSSGSLRCELIATVKEGCSYMESKLIDTFHNPGRID